MRIIEIQALSNGAHRNQTGAGQVPAGWAEIPAELELPAEFPFVALTLEGGRVTAMTGLPVPEEPEAPDEPEEAQP